MWKFGDSSEEGLNQLNINEMGTGFDPTAQSMTASSNEDHEDFKIVFFILFFYIWLNHYNYFYYSIYTLMCVCVGGGGGGGGEYPGVGVRRG